MAIPDLRTASRPERDHAALHSLASDFGRLYTVVHRYLLHRLFDAELAEELTAETFYKAVTASGRLPSDSGHMQYWLLRTATNLANTHHRRKRLHELVLRRFPNTRPVVTGQEGETTRVRAALQALRSKYQSVVVLRFYSQLSVREISVVLGCGQDAVRARLSRAMKEMRERLGVSRSERPPSST
jgi:RNA polymerase sigma-70 factor (ECF subfamily)